MILIREKMIERGNIKEFLIVLCDKELIGKTLDKEINFVVKPEFFKGEEKSVEEMSEIAGKATIINALGQESVDFLIEKELISKEDVVKIGNVPHIQVFFM